MGSKTLGMASYLRAACMNRNIWGAEGFEEISIRHSKFASHRFAHQAAPALARFATSSHAPFLAEIRAARAPAPSRIRMRGWSWREAAEDSTSSCLAIRCAIEAVSDPDIGRIARSSRAWSLGRSGANPHTGCYTPTVAVDLLPWFH